MSPGSLTNSRVWSQDLAGGLVATLPSEKDFENPETGPLLRKFLQGREGVQPKTAPAFCASSKT